MDAIANSILDAKPHDKADDAMEAFDQDRSIKAGEAKDAADEYDRAMSRQQIKDFKARGERPPYTPGNGMTSDESWAGANTVMAQKEKKVHHKKHHEESSEK